MASLTITIPDIQIPRILTALTRILKEGEAVDLENPTNEEIRLKLKSLCIKHIKDKLKEQETILNYEAFEFEDINIS